MTTEPKRLIVTADEARALHDGGTVEVWRPMKPQPYMILTRKEWESRALSGVDSYARPIGAEILEDLIEQSPFPTGSRWWVAEAVAIVPATAYRYSEGVIQRVNPIDRHYSAIYKAGWGRSGKQPWQSSTQMPRWASRTNAEVITCRVELKDGVWHWVSEMKGEKA